MKKEKILELGKKRYGQLSFSDICNGTVFGIISLWVIWVSTSLLIRFMG